MTPAAVDPTLGAWLRRLPHYLYLADLIAGKRVLEVGCGVGLGAQFLANHGAARVVGVDRSLRAISEARARHRQTNLELRCEDPASIELEDASFDCIFVPRGVEVLRRRTVLAELRRLLAPEGTLVLSGASSDRRGAPAGASFHEFRERLEPLFAPVRMIAQAPLVGFSLVEYGDEAEVPAIELDTSLLELTGGEPEPSDYVAVCGGPPGPLRGLAVIQLPDRQGLDAVVAAVTGRPASPPAVEEGRAPGQDEVDLARELRVRLESAIEDGARARAEAAEARGQLEELRLRQAEASATTEAPAAEAAAPAMPAGSQPVAASDEEPDAGPAAAQATAAEQIAEALEVHREVVRSLELAVEEGQAYAEELRAELEQARAAADEARAAGAAAAERAERLEAELRDWRTRASTLEGQLMRASAGAGPSGGEVAGATAAVVPPRPPRNGDGDRARSRAARDTGIEREVQSRIRHIEGELGTGRTLLQQIEEGLAVLEQEAARTSAERAPSAWAAHRDQQLRELAAELGVKDAEITILHVGVSALRARIKELIEEVRRAAGSMRGRSAPEMLDLMDRLSARLAAFEERE